jgi:acyl-CoA thioesterase
MSDLPDVLQLQDLGGGRFRLPVPDEDPEGRDVVFSGQLLGQMLVASELLGGTDKDAKSIHGVFLRAGSYQRPYDLTVEPMLAGRTWASDTVTGWQDDKVMARATILRSVDDPDLMRHQPPMPDVPGPEGLEAQPIQAFPGAEVRAVPDVAEADGVPAMAVWHRGGQAVPTVAANQAVLIWATCGELIGLAMRPHRDVVRIDQAHLTISTGVMGHTVSFHERFDATEWLLVHQEATYAGRGRVHGHGSVFTQDGRLVATFTQDAMVRSIQGTLDPRRAM